MLVHIGKIARRGITAALVFMMLLGSLMAPASGLAQSQSIQSTLTGVTVSYVSPYELFEDGQYVDENMETMMFVGPADILAMGFLSPLIDLNGARDIMLEALFGEIGTAVTLDRGDYTGVSYSLDMLNIDGAEMAVFSLFMNQRSHGYSEFYIYLAPPSLFGSSMQAAQNAFTINGNPLMDGVDATVMGNMVTQNIGVTGGAAVTDVTDVADGSESETTTTGTDTSNTQPAPTATTSTDTGESEGNVDGEAVSYLLLVFVEYSAVDSSLSNYVGALNQLGKEEITPDQARVILDEEAAFLSGTNDRIAQIPVPASMQEFHQETLAWANSVTTVGTTWIDFVEGRGDQNIAANALTAAIDVHIEFGKKLQAQQVSIGEQSGTTETTGTTATADAPEPTEVAQTESSSGSADVNSYVQSVQDHRIAFAASFGRWNESFGLLEGEPSDADIQAARTRTLAEAEYWAGFSANAAQLTPPPGYEDAHEAYLAWAAHITELGNLWIAAMNGDEASLDAFFELVPDTQQIDDDLQAALTAAAEPDTGASTSTSTETTSRTSRSGTSADVADDDTGNTSETSSRTSRTGTTPDDADDEAGNSSATTSRTTRGGSSETDESEGPLPNEWVAEANGVSITWSDDFAINEAVDSPRISDLETGEDTLALQAETAEGTLAPVWVTVVPNEGNDPNSLIDVIINDPSAAVDIWGEGTEVHDSAVTESGGAVLMHAVDDIGGYWIYLQVTCVSPACDTLVLVEIVTEGAPMIDTLELAQSGLAVDGVFVTGAVSVSDAEDVIDRVGD